VAWTVRLRAPVFRGIPLTSPHLSLTIPIIDRQCCVIAVLGGTPRDVVEWKHITDGAARMLREHLPRIQLPPERLHHRCAQESFAAIARGPSHGGGQTVGDSPLSLAHR
jgi:hypothetical protein